jgi:phage-related minor tail protein
MAKKPTDESKGKEVEVVVDQTELDAQFKEEKKDSKAVNSSLKEVIENLKDQTEQGKKVAQGQLDLAEMDKKIAALQGGLLGASTENAAALREQFTALQNAITASGGVATPDQTDMIDSLKEGVESEEEKREKKKQLATQNSALGKLATGLEGFDKTLNGMLDGAGKAAFGFGALALLFNPQLFLDGVFFVVDLLSEAFNALGALISGDVLGFMGIFAENFIGFSAILGILAIKFKVIILCILLM